MNAADPTAAIAAALAGSAAGDRRAFAELYRLTSAKLFAVALRIVHDTGHAEEVLQECYVSIWNHAGDYSAARSQPMTWLAAIVRNRCLDSVRRSRIDTTEQAFSGTVAPLVESGKVDYKATVAALRLEERNASAAALGKLAA